MLLPPVLPCGAPAIAQKDYCGGPIRRRKILLSHDVESLGQGKVLPGPKGYSEAGRDVRGVLTHTTDETGVIGGTGMRRTWKVLGLAALVLAFAATPALAHNGGEEGKADGQTLARQAIILLQNNKDVDMAWQKMAAAKKTDEVDAAQIEAAEALLQAGDLHGAVNRLAAATGASPEQQELMKTLKPGFQVTGASLVEIALALVAVTAGVALLLPKRFSPGLALPGHGMPGGVSA